MLRENAGEYLARKIVIQDDYNFIILPKLVKFFKKDYCPGLLLEKGEEEEEDELKLNEDIKLMKALSNL